MSRIFKKLSSACLSGFNDYISVYQKNIKKILPILADNRILKSHIKTKEIDHAMSLLRFSLVFNDLSFMTYTGSEKVDLIVLDQEWLRKNIGDEVIINTSKEKLDSLGIDYRNDYVAPMFMYPKGYEIDRLALELQPFIKNGKMLILPERMVMFYNKDSEGRMYWKTLTISELSKLEQWELVYEQESRPIPLIDQFNDQIKYKDLFEITIPYLEGVSFKNLSKILEDDGDLISSLRASIKIAIENCKKGDDPNVIARDVIEPKVDQINRKFHSIINSYSFRIAGAAIGTVVLAYSAAITTGLSSSIATTFGSGGLGILGREYSSFKEKMNTLKENPYYFLWRCKKLRK